jgi:hypothetical protein
MLILDEVRKGPVTPRQKQPSCYECEPLPVVRVRAPALKPTGH